MFDEVASAKEAKSTFADYGQNMSVDLSSLVHGYVSGQKALYKQLQDERTRSGKLFAALKEIVKPGLISRMSNPTMGRPWVIVARKAILEYEGMG